MIENLIIKTLPKTFFLIFVLFVFFTQIFTLPLYAQDFIFPQYDGLLNDYENIITNDDELENKLINFYSETGVEIAVVTVDSFQGSTIDDYAVHLYEYWKIGNEESDNGLLILVSSKERQSRFEVGYGLEGTINDAKAGRIQDQFMIPFFIEGDYSTGINNGVDAVISELKGNSVVSETTNSTEEISEDVGFDFFIFFAFFLFSAIAYTKSWWLGGLIGLIAGVIFGYNYFPGWGIYIFPIPFAIVGLIIDFILSKIFASSSRGGTGVLRMFSGGSSSSGSSSGFSFGGGSSGGGGASRSW